MFLWIGWFANNSPLCSSNSVNGFGIKEDRNKKQLTLINLIVGGAALNWVPNVIWKRHNGSLDKHIKLLVSEVAHECSDN